ncbi:unnamed protein product [Paramecium octaurelia]|uniref:PPM-type phosphatase domain-containing protein n=1 Tax=Paramecium octaurelia TaxID=43137 RepID=A0A8S1XQ87_PAROT|nr:unnamed protein product [Paramecium octaurelia]
MQKSLISPNKLFEHLEKRREQLKQASLKSPIISANKHSIPNNRNSKQLIDVKKTRPKSSVDCNNLSTVFTQNTHVRQNSKIIDSKENSSQLSTCAMNLLKKIKSEKLVRPARDLVQYNNSDVKKQYELLLDLAKKPLILKLLKQPRSISNPEILVPQYYIQKAHGQSQAGMLYTGQTKINQDTFKLVQKFCGQEDDWYFQVSDGHGTYGHQVAQFIYEALPQLVEKELKQLQNQYEKNRSIHQILKQCFTRANQDLLKSGIDVTYSGSTTVVVVTFNNELHCANIGDSRAIIGRYDGKLSVVELSKDHKPDCFLEQTRILSRGGRVLPYSDEEGQAIGPARVWTMHEDVPGLAMSRSFGDYVASQVGVICEPEILRHSLQESDKFVIVASDGIWEFLQNDLVVQIVYEFYKKGDVNGACVKLIQIAREAWQREDEVIDDITLIIGFFK